jgi:hypothetical protein
METYRDYEIYYDPKPIPDRRSDWNYVHKDYDGGYYDEEGNVCEADPRHGCAESIEACKREIDCLYDEEE